MDEETKKPEVQVEQIHPDEETGFVAIVLPPEYIHWTGFVVSFLFLVITSIFLKYDDLVAGETISPLAYIDMFMMCMAMLSCIRCLYRYMKAWFKAHGDEDDEDSASDVLRGSTTWAGGNKQAHV